MIQVEGKRLSKKKMQVSGLLFFLSILESGALATVARWFRVPRISLRKKTRNEMIFEFSFQFPFLPRMYYYCHISNALSL